MESSSPLVRCLSSDDDLLIISVSFAISPMVCQARASSDNAFSDTNLNEAQYV
jgi:hypothetical protein